RQATEDRRVDSDGGAQDAVFRLRSKRDEKAEDEADGQSGKRQRDGDLDAEGDLVTPAGGPAGDQRITPEQREDAHRPAERVQRRAEGKEPSAHETASPCGLRRLLSWRPAPSSCLVSFKKENRRKGKPSADFD